jgi:hypothetical protein
MGELTKAEVRQAAEALVDQAEAQGLPRTIDDSRQLEALGRIISEVIERQERAS